MGTFPENRRRALKPAAVALTRGSRPRFGGSSAAAPQDEQNGSLLLEYYRTLTRHWRQVVLFGLIGFLASFLINFRTLPIYRSRTSLDIQMLNSDFMGMHAVAPTGDGSGTSGETYVQTQIKLLESDTLLDNTVARLKAEPHPKFVERDDLLSRMERAVHLHGSAPIPYDEMVNNAAKGIKVKPLGVTRLIEITCDSWNAKFSAKFCNTLTSEFQDEDLETRGTEAQKTSAWLTRQLADVRIKAEEAQKQLEAAVGGNGLVLSQESSTVGEDRLRELQGELVKAQADRIDKEAQSKMASSASPDSVPGVVDSPNYRSLQQKLSDLQARVAQIVPPLTEANPRVIHLRSQIREVKANLAQERSAGTGMMTNEYIAAVHREALLTAAYQALKADVSNQLSKASQVSLLRREVDSEQQLYQTLLQRAREAGFASALHASTIRIVDAARKPKIPIAPRRGVAMGVGLLLGSFLGIGLAFFKDRTYEVLRMPGDVQRYLHVEELGAIPSATGGRHLLHASRSLRRQPADDARQNALVLAKWNDNFSIIAEAYRSATLSILLSDAASRDHARIYIVGSPNSGDGKTTVTSNLGVALSKSKLRVLLVEGDLRKPALHKELRVQNGTGLRNILRGEVNLALTPVTDFCQPTEVPNLFLLSAGTGNEEVVELLHSDKIGDLFECLSSAFDVILIDTPPMLHMADARLFARHADGVILVFRAGSTLREQAANAVEIFDHDSVRIVGTILNDFDPAREGRSGYYKSYNRYKQEVEAADEVMSHS